MIIDVTDPRNPVEKALIPAPNGGQAQMARMCLGSQLTRDKNNKKVYLMRNVQANNNLAISGYQVWDVTDVAHPVKASELTGIRSTHKQWWECNTGITYMPGKPEHGTTVAAVTVDAHLRLEKPQLRRRSSSARSDCPARSRPAQARHRPRSTVRSRPTSIPTKHKPLARAAGPNDVIGNRIYAAWGVGDDGVMTIIDRKKLLPVAYGGSWVPANADSAVSPTRDELIGPKSPTVGYFLMSPDQGGHTSMPVFGMKPPSYTKFNEFATRDIVLLASEATADGEDGRCDEAPHWSFIVDVTVENSMTRPPGTRVEQDPYHGPMVLSTMSVDERSGAKYARGNYCGRGARFGVHSSEENFKQPAIRHADGDCVFQRRRAHLGHPRAAGAEGSWRSTCPNPMRTPTRTAT